MTLSCITHLLSLQQLAALLLTRQVVGNIKESCIPYLLEQFKLAKLSFDLYGALSPTEDRDPAKDWPQHQVRGGTRGRLGLASAAGHKWFKGYRMVMQV